MRSAVREEAAVYEWEAWDGFLIQDLLPNAQRIVATPRDDPRRVCRDLGAARSFVFHIDCAVTRRFPLRRIDLLRELRGRRMRLVNADVVDISKTTIQRFCRRRGFRSTAASRSGPADELVIVKTTMNCSGISVARLSRRDRQAIGIGELVPPPRLRGVYQVMRRREVPVRAWSDPAMACERFITNADGVWFRCWVFHSRLVACRLINPAPIKKMRGSRIETVWYAAMRGSHVSTCGGRRLPPPVADAAAFARQFHLDFGSIDLVVDDRGAAYIVDVNSTPAYSVTVPHLVEHLRQS